MTFLSMLAPLAWALRLSSWRVSAARKLEFETRCQALLIIRFPRRNTVTATTSTQQKIDFLLKMSNGATHGVNYKTQDFFEETQRITKQKGVDVIVDFVGRSHWHKNIASAARDGRMTLLAFLSGTYSSQIAFYEMLSHSHLRYQGARLKKLIWVQSCTSVFTSRALPCVVAPRSTRLT